MTFRRGKVCYDARGRKWTIGDVREVEGQTVLAVSCKSKGVRLAVQDSITLSDGTIEHWPRATIFLDGDATAKIYDTEAME